MRLLSEGLSVMPDVVAGCANLINERHADWPKLSRCQLRFAAERPKCETKMRNQDAKPSARGECRQPYSNGYEATRPGAKASQLTM